MARRFEGGRWAHRRSLAADGEGHEGAHVPGEEVLAPGAQRPRVALGELHVPLCDQELLRLGDGVERRPAGVQVVDELLGERVRRHGGRSSPRGPQPAPGTPGKASFGSECLA